MGENPEILTEFFARILNWILATFEKILPWACDTGFYLLRGVEWVHDLFLFPLVLGKMKLPYAKLGLFCVV